MFKLNRRPADEVIGERYLQRWHLYRRPGVRNLYLHRYLGSDDDRALHDHPWPSLSILFWGSLLEVTDSGVKRIWPFIPKFRSAEYSHRLVLNSKSAWTLFYTGSKCREWGFHCPQGWKHWSEFTDENGNQVGSGCGNED